MAQRDSAKPHNWLCYLIAASTPACEEIFQRVRRRDILSSRCHRTSVERLQWCIPLPSGNRKFISYVSAEGNIWCMHVLRTAPWHVVNFNKLSSPFALSSELGFLLLSEETALCILTLLRECFDKERWGFSLKITRAASRGLTIYTELQHPRPLDPLNWTRKTKKDTAKLFAKVIAVLNCCGSGSGLSPGYRLLKGPNFSS